MAIAMKRETIQQSERHPQLFLPQDRSGVFREVGVVNNRGQK